MADLGRTRSTSPPLRPGRASNGIDADAFHSREVDDEAVVAHGMAGEAVTSPTYGRLQTIVAGEGHGPDDVVSAGTTRNEGGSAVKHAVPHLAPYRRRRRRDKADSPPAQF